MKKPTKAKLSAKKPASKTAAKKQPTKTAEKDEPGLAKFLYVFGAPEGGKCYCRDPSRHSFRHPCHQGTRIPVYDIAAYVTKGMAHDAPALFTSRNR